MARGSFLTIQGSFAQAQLVESSTTLIVVPGTLIDHWKYQITAHTRKGVLKVLAVAKKEDLLPAEHLALYDVVITTFDQLSKEWAVANPAPGSERWYKLHGTVGRGTQSWRISLHDYEGVGSKRARAAEAAATAEATASELLRVQWQRVVLDEGHVMGASADTNRALMLGSIVAGAKWICTGTPAPSTPAAELQHMYGLIAALDVQPYSRADVWRALVHRPFESHDVGSWVRLHALLARIMIRSVKADMERLGEIPTCQVISTELDLSRPEKKAYNGLIAIIQRNILLAECGGSRVDSLLHKNNRKYALEAINNARKACCVTGQFNLELVRPHLEECIADMRRGHSLHEALCQCNGSYFDVPTLKQRIHSERSGQCPLLEDKSRVVPEVRVAKIKGAFAGVGGSGGERAVVADLDGHVRCEGCQQLSVFPLITPCGHMLCIECVSARDATSQCPICEARYSHGRFAHFQPSVENPKMEWSTDWIDAVSTKVALLLTRLRAYGFFGKLPVNENWWSQYVAKRVRHSTNGMASRVRARGLGAGRRSGKCIVFSNFIEAIDSVANTISEALYGHGIFMRFTTNMKRGMQERIEALKLFRDDPTISVLLLDGTGAVGLDLSFVSHIFLLDPIWDKSQEDQVISRAHRLGARQAIIVEKFIARDTVEHMMEALEREPEAGGKFGVDVAGVSSHAEPLGGDDEREAGRGGGEEREEPEERGGGLGSPRALKRQRGDELKRQRETKKIHRILTSIHSLPYDPSAEREREELTDAIEAQAQAQASLAAWRADTAHYDTGGALRAGPTSLSEVEGHFFPAPAYQGEREGFVFKSGLLGLGYYPDGVSNGVSGSAPSRLPQPVRHAAGAHGGARASVDDVPSGAAGRRVRFAE